MASNIVEILIGAKDDAKLDLDSLKQKLTDLAHQVAEAQVKVKGDKEAEASLDRLGVKLIQIGKRTENPKISLEGQFKAMAELGALDVALDRVGKKADGNGSGGGLTGSLRNMAMQGSTALEKLGSAGTTFINPLTISLGALVAILLGPLVAALAPITLGFAAFGAVAVREITKVITAHQKLQAAQQAYAKATTPAGQASALKAEQAALAGLSGPEKQVMGLMNQLGNEFHKLSKAVQPQVVKAFSAALKILKDLMPTIIPLAQAAGKAITRMLNDIDSWLRSGSGKAFLHWMGVEGPRDIRIFGQAMWVLIQALGIIFTRWKSMGDALYADVKMTFNGIVRAWHGAVSAFQSAASAIAGVFNSIRATVGGAVDWIVGKIHTLTSALGSVNGALGGIPGKILGGLGLAAGGIAGAAAGGVRSNLTMVGEHGPELVQLSAGSRVYNNSQTRQMMAGGGSGPGQIVLHVNIAGHKLGHVVVDMVQNHVRTAGGGDVQVALGASS